MALIPRFKGFVLNAVCCKVPENSSQRKKHKMYICLAVLTSRFKGFVLSLYNIIAIVLKERHSKASNFSFSFRLTLHSVAA